MAKIRSRTLQTSENHEVLEINTCGIQFIQSRRTEKLSPKTVGWYQKKITEIQTYFESQGITIIDDLTSVAIRDYLDWLEEKGHNSGGIHAYYRVLKALLNWIWDEYDLAVRNPIDKVKCKNILPPPIEGITMEEVQASIAACSKTKFPERARAIISVLVDTGLRRSELHGLKMKDVRISDGRIVVRHGKGDKFRIVYCGNACRKYLRRYLNCLTDIKDDDPLWISMDGEPLAVEGIRDIIRSAQRYAGITKTHDFHDFRRCYALERKRNGDDAITIARALGHSRPLDVVTRYLAFSTDDDRDFALRASPMDNMSKR